MNKTEPVFDLYSRLDDAVSNHDCDIFKLCHDISVIKGFWETPVPELTALGYRQLVHIAAEINEAEAERKDNHMALATSEYADIVILLSDLAGAFDGAFLPRMDLSQVKYNVMFTLNLDLAAQFGELCQAVYKHGFTSPAAMGEGMKFLNSACYYGVACAGGTDNFQVAILSKCHRNMSRPIRFGLGEK